MSDFVGTMLSFFSCISNVFINIDLTQIRSFLYLPLGKRVMSRH